MLSVNEYLPIGSVVLLKGAIRKAMIIGIIQSTKEIDGQVKEHDYIAVMFPEGFLNTETMFMFNHDQINDVIYRGYENPERKEFLEKLEKNIALAKEIIEKKKVEENSEAKQNIDTSVREAKKLTTDDIF
ncbi:DUF4176 domain-containing protein [Phascolarctobacterium succinatutens]